MAPEVIQESRYDGKVGRHGMIFFFYIFPFNYFFIAGLQLGQAESENLNSFLYFGAWTYKLISPDAEAHRCSAGGQFQFGNECYPDGLGVLKRRQLALHF